MKIRIGNTVEHSLFGGDVLIGVIEEIEICKQGEKSGRPVKQCDTSKHNNGVLTLNNGHWCYFYQIRKIID